MRLGVYAGLALAIASQFFCNTVRAEGAGAHCSLPRVGVIKPVFDHGQVLLPAKLNGEDVFFLFTGSTSWIRLDVADRLRMGSGERVYGISSEKLDAARLGALDIGGLHWENVEFVPSAEGRTDNPAIVGTIGLDAFYFANVDLDLNLAEDTISELARNDCDAPPWAPNAQPLTFLPGGFVFGAVLDGKRLAAVLAPAYEESRMPSETAHARFDLMPVTPFHPEPVGPPVLTEHQFQELQLSDVSLKPLNVQIVKQMTSYFSRDMVDPRELVWFMRAPTLPHAVGPETFLMLGSADLRRLHIYIAFARREIFFAPIVPPRE